MKYVLKDHVTDRMLRNQFFNKYLIRGEGMGWEHHVDIEKREVRFTFENYAKKYDRIGGLRIMIRDLIILDYVEEKK